MKTIVIAGGAGYLGSRMVGYFLSKGYDVTVLDRLFWGEKPIAAYKTHQNFHLRIGDIRNVRPDDLKGFDAIINLAAISNDPASELNTDATFSINHRGAFHLARTAKEAKVPRYLFSSSCSIYGKGEGKFLDETSPLHPVSTYALSKQRAEEELLKLSDRNFAVTILRKATLYGSSARMRFDLLINLMTLTAHTKKKIFILGGGNQWRPLLHLDDAICAYELVLNAPVEKVEGEIFNCGSDRENYAVRDVAKLVKDEIPDATIEETPDDPDKRTYHVDFKKIRERLGFDLRHSARDGIREVRDALARGEVRDDTSTRTIFHYRDLLSKDPNILEPR